jgi:4-amino-4-deoxy-L-arabinose transferase-like glycosyltransferase
VLAKGLIGVVLPGLVVGTYLLLTRRWRDLAAVPWVSGLGVFLAVALPWHLAAALRNPGFASFYFVHEHVLRYATDEARRFAPVWFFLLIVVIGFLPWTGLLPAAGRLLLRDGWRRVVSEQPQVVYLLSWCGLTLLFFSMSRSKLATYILPALPPLAVLVGMLLARLGDGRVRATVWDRVGLAAAGLLVAALGAAVAVIGVRGHARVTQEGTPLPVLVAVGACIIVAALVVLWGACSASPARRPEILFVAALLAGVATAEAWVAVGRQRTVQPVADVLESHLRAGDLVFTYRAVQECLWAYLQRPVGAVECPDELEFGIQRLPASERVQRFPSAAEFKPIWESEQRVWVVAKRWGVGRMRGDGLDTGTTVWSNDRWMLVTNHPLDGRR